MNTYLRYIPLCVIIFVLCGQLHLAHTKLDAAQEYAGAVTVENSRLQYEVDVLADSLTQLSHVYERDRLWLTRTILSETKRVEEFDEVATVVRNRVKRHYRGDSTYKAVVTHPWQFTAIGGGRKYQRYEYLTMTADNTPFPDLWAQADSVAGVIMTAANHELPLKSCVTKFYSPQSMEPSWSIPRWIYHYEQVHSTLPNHRFRFYGSC